MTTIEANNSCAYSIIWQHELEAMRKQRKDPPLTHEELRQAMSYDPETGELRWRHRDDRSRSWNTRFAGKVAGSILTNGYRYIDFGGRLCLAHRVVRFYVTGIWPTTDTDHRRAGFAGRADNRWENLRDATQAQNSANQVRRSNNKSGVKGVYWDKKKRLWVAMITKDYKQRFLGYFSTVEDAAAVRREAEAEHHGEFAYQGAA
jgi:hypothetical protein